MGTEKNARAACTYVLKNENKLEFGLVATMDGNGSLKRVLRRAFDLGLQDDEKPAESSSHGTDLKDNRSVSGTVYIDRSIINKFGV